MQMTALKSPPQNATRLTNVAELYENELDYVMASLRRLGVRLQSDLEDLAHEIFLTAHRRFSDYDQSRPVRPWLFGITYRVLWSHRRLARQTREQFAQPGFDIADSGQIDPEQAVNLHQERNRVQTALAEVDLESRAVLILLEIDGCSASVVAQALDIAVPTVYGRRRNGLKQLERALLKQRRRQDV